MTAEMEAHVYLTPALASISKTWQLEIDNLEAEIKADTTLAKAQVDLIRVLKTLAIHLEFETRTAKCNAAIKDKKDQIKEAAAGYLLVTRAESEALEGLPFGLCELIKMARLIGRLKIID
jgi:hypothetical protein